VDDKEILVAWYQEENNFARHHEELRGTAANVIVAVAAGGLGLIAFDQKLLLDDLPLATIVALLGVLGAVLSAKQYERVRLHLNRARQFEACLDELVPKIDLMKLRKAGTRINEEQFPHLAKWRLYWFWVALNVIIALIGAVLVIAILIEQRLF